MQHHEAVPIRTHELSRHVGRHVQLRGWLQHQRKLGAIAFAVVRDGWATAQVVCMAEIAARLATIAAESVVHFVGVVVENESAPGGFEVRAEHLEVLVANEAAPPLTLAKPTLEVGLPVLLDHAALALRHPAQRALFRLSAATMSGFRATLGAAGFTEVQTPKIVESATEGGSNVFEIDYFGRRAFLAQSPQFYKQTMVGVFERVFEVGPVFRAEPHATSRHINEYVSLDVEMGFIESHRTVMGVLRQVLAGIMTHIQATCPRELELLGLELPQVPDEIPVIEFHVAKAICGSTSAEPDLAPAEERALGDWALREHGSAFVFVEGYPLHKRPFYTHPAENGVGSNSFDLLFRGTELVTGGQRLHRYEDYVAALTERGLPQAPFEGYLQAFRYGMPPHGGFAIGLERFLMQLSGVGNIRHVTLFPRDIHRLGP